jgi:hypothetical protein
VERKLGPESKSKIGVFVSQVGWSPIGGSGGEAGGSASYLIALHG